MMFVHDANQAIAAESVHATAGPKPRAQNVAVLPIPRPTAAGQSRVAIPVMETCLRTYQRALNACRIGDTDCRLHASDRWGVCEATGF